MNLKAHEGSSGSAVACDLSASAVPNDDPSAKGFGDLSCEGEAEADASVAPGGGAIDLVEGFEDSFPLLGFDSGASVENFQGKTVFGGEGVHRDDAIGGGELPGVVENVHHRPEQLAGVAVGLQRRGGNAGDKLKVLRAIGGDLVDRPGCDVGEVIAFGVEVHALGLEGRDIDEGVDDVAQTPGRAIDASEAFGLKRCERTEVFPEEQLEVADDGSHRRGEFVGDVSEKLPAQPSHLFQAGVGLGEGTDLVFQPSDDALALFPEQHLAGVVAFFPMAFEKRVDGLGKLPGVDGLLDVAVGAKGEAGLPIPFGGDRDDGNLFEAGDAPNPKGDFVAVEVRDVDVDEDQIRVNLRREAHAFEAALGVEDLVACGGEQLLDEAAAVGIVFDVENASHRREYRSWGIGGLKIRGKSRLQRFLRSAGALAASPGPIAASPSFALTLARAGRIAVAMGKKGRVLVALSGGVDSSVAAALLQEQGYDLIGVTLHLWDASGESQVGRCCAPEDRDDARKTCEHLGIPHFVLDEREAFREQVVEPFLDEYRSGKTPAPCVHCNKGIKLTQLVDLLPQFGATHVATGHYVRLLREDGQLRLFRGRDHGKDQSYFLYGVPHRVLDKMLFPLGDMIKDETRKHGERLGVPNFAKGDSQELCFVPDGNIAAFAKRERGAGRSGKLVDAEGAVLGEHDGVERFTIGQRRGLGLGGGPSRYVLKILPNHDVLVGGHDGLMGAELELQNTDWLCDAPQEPLRAEVRMRYRHPPAEATVHPMGDGRFRVVFDAPQRAITPGQAAVVYRGEEVLGGGFIA